MWLRRSTPSPCGCSAAEHRSIAPVGPDQRLSLRRLMQMVKMPWGSKKTQWKIWEKENSLFQSCPICQRDFLKSVLPYASECCDSC
ncbi:hypothetical protein ILYODFUR_009094 [Ilyodon furcidens]|uniref:Uncharacterized protein n=1 Tax=Ilyodon furcidens TaxID=33524 RepID=A0ABV0TH67_9TELE